MATSKTRRALVGVAAAAALALAAAACGSSGGGGGSGSGGSQSQAGTINTTVKDFSIALATSTAPGGKVTFDITNSGPSAHELVVLRTEDAAAQLPVEQGEANEEAPGVVNVGEQEDIAAGATASLTLTLQPGNYVLICNYAGHYAAGMHAAFTVE